MQNSAGRYYNQHISHGADTSSFLVASQSCILLLFWMFSSISFSILVWVWRTKTKWTWYNTTVDNFCWSSSAQGFILTLCCLHNRRNYKSPATVEITVYRNTSSHGQCNSASLMEISPALESLNCAKYLLDLLAMWKLRDPHDSHWMVLFWESLGVVVTKSEALLLLRDASTAFIGSFHTTCCFNNFLE